ncbi:MAG: replication-relaxation family protein [Actinomycetota bacterium]|nr:replication-relaxation family protein [Actinomycetota bacterium]
MTGLASHLTDRDRYLCGLLAEHRVLTTNQITTVAFDSPISARHRLAELYRLRVLDRFRPFRTVGTAPHHYVLDALGAMVVAAEWGIEEGELSWRRDRALGLATSRQLQHRVGVNGFFCALLGVARGDPDVELSTWWSERRCRARFGEVVRPDGYGVWRAHGSECAFFLEYDRGTETHERLAGKLDGYAMLGAATPDPFVVLFVFVGAKREAQARRTFAGTPVPVATALESVTAGTGFLPVSSTGPRCSLGELARIVHGERDCR